MRFGDALNGIACIGERPARDGRAGRSQERAAPPRMASNIPVNRSEGVTPLAPECAFGDLRPGRRLATLVLGTPYQRGDALDHRLVELCRYRNTLGAVIPERVLTRPHSAELRPDQKDSDSLPPYEVLDPLLQLYVERQLSIPEIGERGFDEAVVGRVPESPHRACCGSGTARRPGSCRHP